MKIAAFHELNDEQLARRQRDLREELFKLLLQKQTAQLEKPSRLKDLRRDIARALTVINQRRLGLVKPAPTQGKGRKKNQARTQEAKK